MRQAPNLYRLTGEHTGSWQNSSQSLSAVHWPKPLDVCPSTILLYDGQKVTPAKITPMITKRVTVLLSQSRSQLVVGGVEVGAAAVEELTA